MGKEGIRYKLICQGCKEGVARVGVLVHQKWIESVIDVKILSE